MLRELLKYVPLAPLAGALVLFAALPFEESPRDSHNKDNAVRRAADAQ